MASTTKSKGAPQTKTGTVTVRELQDLLPCFYDIQLRFIRDIVRITNTKLDRLRRKNGTMDQWPFRIIMQGGHPQLNWRTIRELRGRAILTASPDMRTILFKVELKSMEIRGLYLTKEMRDAIVEDSFFPPFPPDLQPVNRPGPTPDQPTPPAPLASNGIIRYVSPMTDMTQDEVHTAVENMIDLPIFSVTNIMKMSCHTLNGYRAHLGLHEWPYNQIRMGTFQISRTEVVRRREEILRTLRPDAIMLRAVLQQAASKSFHIASNAAVHVVTSPPPTPSSPPAAATPTMELEELQDWFGCLVESPPLQPKAEDWVMDEIAEANVASDPFWDPDALYPVSPGTQAYWSNLIDLPPQTLT